MCLTQKPIRYLFKGMPEENEVAALIKKIDLEKAEFSIQF